MSEGTREMTDLEKIDYFINLMEKVSDPILSYKWEKDFILKLLKEKLEQRWIPVSERLPNKYDCNYLITAEEEKIFTSKFYGYGEECQGFREFPEGVWELDAYEETIIAWQPLPEPYKEVTK